jgi:hypothetical protein
MLLLKNNIITNLFRINKLLLKNNNYKQYSNLSKKEIELNKFRNDIVYLGKWIGCKNQRYKIVNNFYHKFLLSFDKDTNSINQGETFKIELRRIIYDVAFKGTYNNNCLICVSINPETGLYYKLPENSLEELDSYKKDNINIDYEL